MTMDPVAHDAQENSNQKFYCETITHLIDTKNATLCWHIRTLTILFLFTHLFSHHLNQKKQYVHSWCHVFCLLCSFEYNPLYVYFMSSVIHQARKDYTMLYIYRPVHPCSRGELADGHELGQKNMSFFCPDWWDSCQLQCATRQLLEKS